MVNYLINYLFYNKFNMKKIITVLILAISILALSSCGKKTTTTHKVNNDTNVVTTDNTNVKNTVTKTASTKAKSNADADADKLLQDVLNNALK